MTVEQLADRLGLPPAEVARIERDERSVEVAELMLIARACGRSVASFLDGG